jgi:hypothetical protein
MIAVGANAPAAVLAFIETARRQQSLVHQFFSVVGGRIMMASTMVRMSRPLERARAEINQWRQRAGRPLAPPRAPNEPLFTLGMHVLKDVREMLNTRG